jgi:hypothetical protein
MALVAPLCVLLPFVYVLSSRLASVLSDKRGDGHCKQASLSELSGLSEDDLLLGRL